MNPTRLWIYGLLTRWMPETRLFALKVRLLRWCGAQVGENVRVCSSAVIRGNGRLVIGNDVWIGSEDYLSPVGEAVIRIGDCCDLAPRVTILTGTHEVNSAATPGGGYHVAGKGKALGVSVGNGCWLCAASVILPGVSLADRTLVAAGAVVTRSMPTPNRLVAGIPAQEKHRPT